MHTFIYTHAWMHTFMLIYIRSCAQTYTNTYTYRQAQLACVHTQTVKHPYMHTHACTHVRMHALMHAHTHTHALHACSHMHTHTSTHTHIADTYTACISLRTDMDALPCALLVCRLLCPDWWGFPAVAKKWEVEKSESVTLRHHLSHALFWWPQRPLAGWLAASVWVPVYSDSITCHVSAVSLRPPMFQLSALDLSCFSCQP